jgi:hypothetical protein
MWHTSSPAWPPLHLTSPIDATLRSLVSIHIRLIPRSGRRQPSRPSSRDLVNTTTSIVCLGAENIRFPRVENVSIKLYANKTKTRFTNKIKILKYTRGAPIFLTRGARHVAPQLYALPVVHHVRHDYCY